jgi:hypothetical protein
MISSLTEHMQKCLKVEYPGPQSRQSAKLLLQSSELGLPQPPTRRLVCPLPPVSRGEGNTRWRERGWESPNSDEGHTLWYSLYVRTLCPGRIEYNFQKFRVTGPWDHKDSISAIKYFKKFHACVPLSDLGCGIHTKPSSLLSELSVHDIVSQTPK